MQRLKLFIAICFPLFLAGLGGLVVKNTRQLATLDGDITYNDSLPIFSKSAWLNGHYQDSISLFLNDNFGFRNHFVRTRNQLFFSLFNEPKANAVVVGNKNYLYEENYIKELYGNNFLGADSIHQLTQLMKDVNELLKAQDKTLMVVLAPGKASFFPEFIPTSYQPQKFHPKQTNYHFLQSDLKESSIAHIDARSWFLQMKDTSRYLLYGSTGIHWTKYGQHLFIDSLNKKLQQLGYSTPHIQTKVITLDAPRMPDHDLEKGLNLFQTITNEKFCYPTYSFQGNKLNSPVVLVSDSYLWDAYAEHYFHNLFEDFSLYYFNIEAFDQEFKKEVLNPKKRLSDLLKSEVFVIVCTEANYERFSFSYLNDIYQLLSDEDWYENYAKEIQRIMGDIQLDEKWSNIVKQQAKEQNISFEEALENNAVYMYNLKNK